MWKGTVGGDERGVVREGEFNIARIGRERSEIGKFVSENAGNV